MLPQECPASLCMRDKGHAAGCLTYITDPPRLPEVVLPDGICSAGRKPIIRQGVACSLAKAVAGWKKL